MKKTIYLATILAMVSLVGSTTEANAQYRVNQGNAKNVIKRIENGADRFKKSLESGLDRSRLDDTRQEDRINEFVGDFENATDRLRRDWESSNLAQDVLRRGQVIDQFMRRQRLANSAERDWTSLRRSLDQLARLYRVTWNWNDSANNRYDNDNRLGNNGRYNDRNINRIDINYGTVETLIANIETKADSFNRTGRV